MVSRRLTAVPRDDYLVEMWAVQKVKAMVLTMVAH